MTQSTVLALGIAAADSSAIVVGDSSVSVGVFAGVGNVPALGQALSLMMTTPGEPNFVASLAAGGAAVSISGRGSYFVRRSAMPAGSTPLGVYTEVA